MSSTFPPPGGQPYGPPPGPRLPAQPQPPYPGQLEPQYQPTQPQPGWSQQVGASPAPASKPKRKGPLTGIIIGLAVLNLIGIAMMVAGLVLFYGDSGETPSSSAGGGAGHTVVVKVTSDRAAVATTTYVDRSNQMQKSTKTISGPEEQKLTDLPTGSIVAVDIKADTNSAYKSSCEIIVDGKTLDKKDGDHDVYCSVTVP